jgi:hypothetical protein
MEIGAICFSSKRTVLAWLERYEISVRAEDAPLRRGLRFGEKRVGGRIIAHKGQLKTIQLMLELRAKGYSYPEIVEVLNSMKIQSKHGGKWYLKTVYEVIQLAKKVATDA